MNRLPPLYVVTLWRDFSDRIPGRFALGAATHETDLDADNVSKHDQSDGTDSIGLYQLSLAEQEEEGIPGDLKDPDVNTAVFVAKMEKNLDRILRAAPTTTSSNPDVWAYLAMSHNMGIGSALKTIEQYGLDWAGYKRRNPTLAFVQAKAPKQSYGDDVITGGFHWTSNLDPLDAPPVGPGSSPPAGGVFGLLVLLGLGYLGYRLL